jgi:hypothetical protein
MKIRHILASFAALLLPTEAVAQTVVLPQVTNAGGAKVPSQGVIQIDSSGVELGTLAVAAASLNSASASGVGADLAKHQARGMVLVVNVSAITGSGASLTVTLQGKDAVSGQYYTLLTSPAITATGMTVLRIYPGITASANAAANDVLPAQWRVAYAITGTSPAVTATVGANMLP